MIALLITTALASGPAALTSDEWMKLVRAGDMAATRTRCEAALKQDDVGSQAEGHKCLANVELHEGGTGPRLEGGKHGGTMSEGCSVETGRRAAAHLDAALKLAPKDLSIHQGRLHILEMAGLFNEMAGALKESIRLYPDPEAIDNWLAYPAELSEMEHYPQMLAMLQVLDAAFPNDNRIVGNIGSAYGYMEKYDEALVWIRKAVALSPKDPIDAFNLANTLRLAGQLDEADKAFAAALKLPMEPEMRDDMGCSYAEFLATELKAPKRARPLARKYHCDSGAPR